MAQQQCRQQDGLYSGQANAQVNAPADERVDGRANKNEGLPPSVSDNGNRASDRMIPRRSMYSDRKRGPDGRQGFVQPGGRIDRPSACWKSLRPQVREEAVKPSRDQARI
jgi:hypothetical protein